MQRATCAQPAAASCSQLCSPHTMMDWRLRALSSSHVSTTASYADWLAIRSLFRAQSHCLGVMTVNVNPAKSPLRNGEEQAKSQVQVGDGPGRAGGAGGDAVNLHSLTSDPIEAH